MSTKHVLIDVSIAGASGDMFLAALLDIIGEDDSLLPVAASLLIYDPTLRVKMIPRSSGDTTGCHLEVTHDASTRFSPSSLQRAINEVAAELELSKKALDLATAAFNEILQAECRAHNVSIDQLHLHETGSIDTVLDIVGTMYLLQLAGLLDDTKFYSTNVAVGNGTIDTEHGVLDVPVPAVSEILAAHDVPFHAGKAETEVLTPTGAALLVTLADVFVDSSEGFIPMNQGAGFGTRELNVPNMMKIIVGEADFAPSETSEATKTDTQQSEPLEKIETTPDAEKTEERKKMQEGWNADEVIVIETNVDDTDGESIGSVFDLLLSEGLAYDVVVIPAFGKKNRPCFVVKVIAPKSGLKTIAEILIRHLGTIGIRYTNWERLKAVRETIVCRLEIDDKEYMVRVKVSRALDGSIINIKPEADDMLKVAKETGISIRELKPRIALQAHAITE
ncbi:MAG: nickel pincer cofactor biosynthesis protein LarC [Candidatus Lokiarchaeota archaeon]|nr:nickel pincer cofactor biosynthesis protein LarC [Candidatus Lokiarchaeota archaeon]